MGLEGANSAFGGIPAVDVRWNQLEFYSPVRRDGVFVSLAGLIVQYLEVHDQLAILEALRDDIARY
jgi:hypothetical protein